MVQPELVDDTLVLRVEGLDKIFALRSELRLPLSHITGVRLDGEVVAQWWHGLKLAGTSLPGVITAGLFYQHGQRVFWDIHHPALAVVLTLEHEFYQELVIEVADPDGFVAGLQAALGRRPARS